MLCSSQQDAQCRNTLAFKQIDDAAFTSPPIEIFLGWNGGGEEDRCPWSVAYASISSPGYIAQSEIFLPGVKDKEGKMTSLYVIN